MMKILLTLLFALMLVTACNNANEKDSVEVADSANKTNLNSPGDQQTVKTDEESSYFLVAAADGAMMEVHFGGMAQQKAKDQAVKEFGGMMITDHSASLERIKFLAEQKNVTLPSDISADHQKKLDDFMTKKDFDRAYITDMIEDHEKDIREFESAREKTKDPDIKAFIDNTLPALRKHLESAKSIKDGLK